MYHNAQVRPLSAPRSRNQTHSSKEAPVPSKPRFGLGPVKDRSLLKGFGEPSPVKPSQYRPSGSRSGGLTAARKALGSRNPAEAIKRIPQNAKASIPLPQSPRAMGRLSSDLGYEVSRPTSTFHPSGDYNLSPRREQTPSKSTFQGLTRGSASASIEGSPLQQLLSHMNSLLREFDQNIQIKPSQA